VNPGVTATDIFEDAQSRSSRYDKNVISKIVVSHLSKTELYYQGSLAAIINVH